MRQGQQNKRMRGRNRKGPNPLTRSFESNGGDVKLRGTALHIAEKYVQLARDAQSSGDRVAAENYFQHAEHYYRIVTAAQAQMPQPQQIIRTDDDDNMMDEEGEGEFRVNGSVPGGPGGDRPGNQGGQGGYGLSDPQPYLNGASEGDEEGNEGGYPPRDMGNGNGFAPREGNGGGQRFQGQPRQGEGGGGERQGNFRRRRGFRDRYGDNRDNRNTGSGATGASGASGERSERTEADTARPESSSEPSDE
jgi:hypothetical protein